jgi:hypothetical protein
MSGLTNGSGVVILLTIYIVNVVVLLLWCWYLHCGKSFYRGYFDEKQRNLGKNPEYLVRLHCGRYWRLYR